MKNLIILFILVAPIKLLGQQKLSDSLLVLIDSLRQNDTSFKKTYYHTDYYHNGKIKDEGYAILLNRNEKWDIVSEIGKWIFYYKNGVIKRIEYSDISGMMINTEYIYNKKQELITEILWDNNKSFTLKTHNNLIYKKGSTIKSYKKGKLIKIITYIATDGKLYKSGKEIFYNIDGSIKKEYLYKDGKKIS